MICDDCGLPISICNAVASVRHAIEREGQAAVSKALANAGLVIDAPLRKAAERALQEAVADDFDEWFADLRAALTGSPR